MATYEVELEYRVTEYYQPKADGPKEAAKMARIEFTYDHRVDEYNIDVNSVNLIEDEDG